MQKIIKKPEDIVVDANDIKAKLYMLTVGEQLQIQTPLVTRIYERIL